MATALWALRERYRGCLVRVQDAIRRAARMRSPICLLDMGDNVGGGSPGDGTVLLHALHHAHITGDITGAFVCLFDPIAYSIAAAAGIGNRVRMSVGGRSDRHHGEPFEADFVVRGLYDGRFEEPEVRHGGFRYFDQGPTAVVQTDGGLTVMVTSKRMVPFSLEQLRSCDLDPTRFRVLVAKGVHAPVAAYAAVCKQLIRVNTPGVTTADLWQLNYRHRRRPMFPFESHTEWAPDDITMGHNPPASR
jgi:microcystin degradation protein MlrC